MGGFFTTRPWVGIGNGFFSPVNGPSIEMPAKPAWANTCAGPLVLAASPLQIELGARSQSGSSGPPAPARTNTTTGTGRLERTFGTVTTTRASARYSFSFRL